MNIIERIDNEVYVDNYKIKESVYSYINKLAVSYFKNIKSINKASKKIIGNKKMNPMYINKDILLVPLCDINSASALCINYYSIKGILIHENETIIVFDDNTTKRIVISSYRMHNAIKKCELIDEYIGMID